MPGGIGESPTRTPCPWAQSSEAMRRYHDAEWGVPSRDDRYLYEMLVLEGAQAGLSWATILRKRGRYQEVFEGFDPERVARFGESEIERVLTDPGIVRNRRKVESAVTNARALLAVTAEFGRFADYLWGWVGGKRSVHLPTTVAEVPSRTDLSDRLSADLRRRGFTFVGPTIVYSYLQAVGVVDDHLVTCPAKRAWAPG